MGSTLRPVAEFPDRGGTGAAGPTGHLQRLSHAIGFENALRRAVPVSVGSVVDLRISLEYIRIGDGYCGCAAFGGEVRALSRNYLALANLTTGVVLASGSRHQTGSAYGNTGLQNAFLLDGGRNETISESWIIARDMIRPPLDALAEFTHSDQQLLGGVRCGGGWRRECHYQEQR